MLIRKLKKKRISIKFLTGVIEQLRWTAGDKVEIEIESEGLKLRKTKG
jgi:hypothetical protein